MKHTLRVGSFLGSLAVGLPGQTWAEAGDAGALPAVAQAPSGSGPLTAITGSLSDGVDMFLIQIDDAGWFTASTVGGAAFDTQLFLFDCHGRGIAMRDDIGGGSQSALSGTFVPAPGRYWLAITPYDRDPVAAGGEIWADAPYDAERAPDGPRAREIVSGWNGSVTAGTYTIALSAVSFPQRQVTLPDHHHLSEDPAVLGGDGSTEWWRAAGGRFQLLFEGSHFTSAGVTGAINIRRLRFRGEDGEANLGGAFWNGAVVQLGATSLTAATLTTGFNTNRSATVTTLGAAPATTAVLLPSLGSTPNNDNLVIDMQALGAGIWLDPTGPRPNLLVDVKLPTAAVVPIGSSAVMAMQDTTGGVAFVRGAGLRATTSTALTGALSYFPLVLGVDFAGAGGAPAPTPARNEFFGAACGGSPASFYQGFANGQPFDLRGLRMVPDDVGTPTRYGVEAFAGVYEPTLVNATPASIADDATVGHALGFTFRFPGGSTTTIRASTNGFVWLDAAGGADYAVSIESLLGVVVDAAPRVCPLWYDFDCGRNTATHPNSGLHLFNTGAPGNRACWITWRDVGAFHAVAGSPNGVFGVQCVLRENGTIEFRYGATPAFPATTTANAGSHGAIVGFSRGRIGGVPSADPRSRDLSLEVPFATTVEGGVGHLAQTVTSAAAYGVSYGGRAIGGEALTFHAANVPPGAPFGVQLLDLSANRPGWELASVTAPGCVVSTSLNPVFYEVHAAPGANVMSAPFTIPPGFEGCELFAQYVTLDIADGAPHLVTAASNAVRLVVGKQ